MRKKHPEKLGFKLGYEVTVKDRTATVEVKDTSATTKQDLVYVAITDDNVCVKTGRTTSGLKGRWQRVFQKLEAEPPKSLRRNELSDRQKLLDLVTGKKLQIWFKSPGSCAIELDPDFGSHRLSLSSAEEEYLDAYYEPKFGVALPLRRRLAK